MTDRRSRGPAQPPPESQAPLPEPEQGPEAPGPEEGSRPADATAASDAKLAAADLRAQVAQLEEAWRQALADLDNLRKRTAKEVAQRETAERARVAAAWLPVLDNLDLALEHAGDADGALVGGIRAVRDQAIAVLAGLGFPRRDDLGAMFDPARHEAVATAADAGAADGTVVRVLRPGYGDDEHQLRPAAVIVAAATTGPG
jgi:molecular chaperone GrpE